jgi:hypothetical protein
MPNECTHCREDARGPHAPGCAIARKHNLPRRADVPPAPYVGAVVQYWTQSRGIVAPSPAVVVAQAGLGDNVADLRVFGMVPSDDRAVEEVEYGTAPGEWSWAPQVWSPR